MLDITSYENAMTRLRWRFAATAGITLAALALGLASIILLGRQGRLGAELNLARERQGRLEEIARLGAGLAHETKNPLSVIRGMAQGLGTEADAERRALAAARMIDEVDRTVGRINAFLNYSRPLEPRWEVVDLAGLAAQAAQLFEDDARAKGVALKVEGSALPARADNGMIRQALVNLLANALAACEPGASITLRIEHEGDRAALTVEDTGRGIEPDDLPRVMQPYFSRTPGGTGLGLAITRQIVETHGWHLRIDSSPGVGTRARIEGIREQTKA
jgi:signal transduction histidine kinase